MSIVKIMVFLPLGKQDILFYISLFPALSFRMKALPEIHLVSSSYCTRGIAHFLQSDDSRFFSSVSPKHECIITPSPADLIDF